MDVLRSDTASNLRLGGPLSGESVPLVLPRQTSPAVAAPTACVEEPLFGFVHWLAVQQRMHVTVAGDQLQLVIPEEDRELFGGREMLELAVRRGRLVESSESADSGHDPPRQVEPLIWLVSRLGRLGPAAHARPDGQPESVHAVAQKLFRAYRIDGGQMHLAGCQLEDRPFLRLSFLNKSSHDGSVRHMFVAPDGSSVSKDMVNGLGLAKITPIESAAPRIAPHELRALVGSGQRMAAQQIEQRNPAATAGPPLATTVVWAKYVLGQIQFSVGDELVMLPFEGWASMLVPPAVRCEHSGAESFHFATIDDGRIVAAEQIATCGYSGRRVLRSKLVQCQATGRPVMPEYTSLCPVTGHPVLTEHFALCDVCRQNVSTPGLARGRCAACRNLKRVADDDPRLVWLMGEYPRLSSWKRWRLAETRTCYIARGSTLLRQLLLVCNRDTLSIERLATRRRGSFRWTAVSADHRQEYLG